MPTLATLVHCATRSTSDLALAGIRTEPGYFSGGDASTPPTRPFTRRRCAATTTARATRCPSRSAPPRLSRGRRCGVWALLLPELKSVAMRARVMYVPHPYVWMGPAHAKSTRLGLECDGIEVELGALPPWEEAQHKTLPVLWKNPVTGELAFQVHPCSAAELLINSLPESAACEAALYPDGAHLTDLKEVRDLLYTMQHLNYLIFPMPKYYVYFALKRLRKRRVFRFIVIGIQCSGCYRYFYA
ncbi:hypothetical protein B0H14DRAFT_3166124 [Mycena olivaceomarginata]|nr:hypothetical protein B0H14DRAFT_3166124 [Mycena olivaceomarginata]